MQKSIIILFFLLLFFSSLGQASDITPLLPNVKQAPLVKTYPLDLRRGRIMAGTDQLVWHSTPEQVSAFNGQSWQRYDIQSTQTWLSSVLSQDVNSLWLGTRQNGVYRYQLATGTLQHVRSDGFDRGELPRYTVNSMCLSTDQQRLLTAGFGSVQLIDTRTGEQQALFSAEQVALSGIVLLCHADKPLILFGNGALYQFDVKSQQLSYLTDLTGLPEITRPMLEDIVAGDGVKPIIIDGKKLIMASGTQLITLSLVDFKTANLGAPLSAPIRSLQQDMAGRVWVSTMGAGIYALNHQGAVVHHLTRENSRLPDNTVISLAFSEQGWLFALTAEHLVQISLQPTPFRYLQHKDTTLRWYAASLGQPDVIWLVEAFARLLTLDRNTQTLTDMTPTVRQFLASQNEDRPLLISAIHHAGKDELWVSSQDYLLRYQASTKQFTKFGPQTTEQEGPQRRVRHIFTDQQQRTWFTDQGSLLLFDRDQQRFKRWPLANPELADRQRRFVKIAEDPQQQLWALGEFGLYRVTDNALHLVYAYQGVGFLSDFAVDEQGQFWLSSSQALIKVSQDPSESAQIFVVPPHLDITLQSIIVHQGDIWLGTRNGVARFNIAKQQWQKFAWADGVLPEISYQRGAYWQNDHLIFMTMVGMLIVDPSQLKPEKTEKLVRHVQVRTGTGDWRPLDPKQPFLMPEAEHWLEFALQFSEFRYPEQLRFRFKLVGYDPDWSRSSDSAHYAYAGVPAGRYRLLVEAIYLHNNQLAASLNFPVHIIPPWYRSVQAYIIYAALLLAAFVLFYRYRQWRVRQLIHYESEIAASYQRALQAQQRQQELALLGDLGKDLTAHLQLDLVWQDFVQAARQLAEFEQALLFFVQPQADSVSCADIVFMPALPENLTAISEQRVSILKPLPSAVLQSLPQALQNMLKAKEVLQLTVSREQKIYGMVFLVAQKTQYFDAAITSPLCMLVEFLAVALENIQAHQHLQRIERQLLQQQKVQALGRLVAGVAHEMNTPAGTAITAASLIQEQLARIKYSLETESLSKSVLQNTLYDAQQSNELVQRNLRRLSGLVEQFKLLAGVNEQPNITLVSMWSLCRLLAEVRAKDSPEVSFTLVLPKDELCLELSKSGLQLVLQQIIDNVFEHAARPNIAITLTISLERGKDELVLSFCDNGRGLQSEKPERYLEPFSTTARHRGLVGLGLAIAHNIVVELFNGSIILKSNPSGGCCVVLSLPAMLEQNAVVK